MVDRLDTYLQRTGPDGVPDLQFSFRRALRDLVAALDGPADELARLRSHIEAELDEYDAGLPE